MLVIDRGDLVILVLEQLWVIDDGQRQHAFTQRRLIQRAAHQARSRKPVRNRATAGCDGSRRSTTVTGTLPRTASAALETTALPAPRLIALKEGIKSVADILLVMATDIFVGDDVDDLLELRLEFRPLFRRIEATGCVSRIQTISARGLASDRTRSKGWRPSRLTRSSGPCHQAASRTEATVPA